MYPYPSALKEDSRAWFEGRDYVVWQDVLSVEERLSHMRGPIIEIGGPTELGFYFLDGVELPSKPVISNISRNPLPYSKNAAKFAEEVEQIVDARSMSYEDESVGVFLMAAMSVSSDWWVGLDNKEKEKAEPKFNKEFDIAKMEMGQVATGVLVPDKVVYAQRVQIYLEICRTLAREGLLFSDGSLEDIAILQRLGFKLVAFLQYQDHGLEGWQSLSYEFVVTK